MIKVCMLTSVHSPFDSRIFYKEGKSLAKAGYDVTIVAQHNKDEIVDGIRIISLPNPKNKFDRMTKNVLIAYRKALEINADVYHFHDPELITIGLLLKLQGKPVIYDVHEYYSEVIPTRFPRCLRCLIQPLIHFLLEYLPLHLFDYLIFPTEALLEEYADFNRAIAIRNYPSLEDVIHTNFPDAAKIYDVVFVGTASPFRLYFMLDVIRKLSLRRSSFHCLLLGLSDVSIKWVRNNYSNEFLERHVTMKRRVPYQEVFRYLAASRVGYNYHPMEKRFSVAIPMKVYEYMLAGLPVVTSAFPELTSTLVEGKEIIFPGSDHSEEHVKAIESLLDNDIAAAKLGAMGQRAIQNRLNFEVSEEPKLINLYHKLFLTSPAGATRHVAIK